MYHNNQNLSERSFGRFRGRSVHHTFCSVFLEIIHYFRQDQTQNMNERYQLIVKKAVCLYAKRAHIEYEARYRFVYEYQGAQGVLELHVTDGNLFDGFTKGEPYDPDYDHSEPLLYKRKVYDLLGITKQNLCIYQRCTENQMDMYLPPGYYNPGKLVKPISLTRLSWSKEEMDTTPFKQYHQTDIRSFSNLHKKRRIQCDETYALGSLIASYL